MNMEARCTQFLNSTDRIAPMRFRLTYTRMEPRNRTNEPGYAKLYWVPLVVRDFQCRKTIRIHTVALRHCQPLTQTRSHGRSGGLDSWQRSHCLLALCRRSKLFFRVETDQSSSTSRNSFPTTEFDRPRAFPNATIQSERSHFLSMCRMQDLVPSILKSAQEF